MEDASAAHELSFDGSNTVLFIARAIFRRIFNKQLAKRGWLTRIVFVIGIIRWLDRKLNKSRVVYLKKDETIVVSTESMRK